MNKIEAMKRFIFLQLIFWTVIGAMAQNSPISTLSIQLEEQVKTNAKQKTFIKTDKDIYAPGEKIWFKAEVINMINHRFENESSLVMMLKAESGEIIVDGKYLISDGVASSQITIPSWANEGNAYLIAYTPTTTINNDASLLAIQPIFINQLRRNDYNINTHFENKIYNPGDEIKLQVEIIPITPSAKKVKATVTLFDYFKPIASIKENVTLNQPTLFKFKVPSEVDNGLYFVIEIPGKNACCNRIPIHTIFDPIKLDFFVEGGNLLLNSNQRVIYRASDPFGNPVDVSGVIIDESHSQVGMGKTLKTGLGLVSFMPLPKHNYQFEINSEYGNKQKFDMPVPVSNGSALTFIKIEDNGLRISVLNSGDFVGKTLYVAAIVKGEVKLAFDFVAQQSNVFLIASDQMSPGIITFAILNQEGKILSERLVYNLPNKDIDISMNPNVKATSSKGEYEFSIDLNKFMNEFGKTWCDIKIVDTQNLFGETNTLQYNLLEYPLLTPTPKNVLERFITNTELIANKYCHYSIQEVLNPIDNKAETSGNKLSGYVSDKSGIRMPNATVMVVTPNSPSMATTKTDKNGHFSFENIAKSSEMVVKAINETGKKNFVVHLYRSFNESLDELILKESFINKKAYKHDDPKKYFEQNEALLKQVGSETKDKRTNKLSNTEKLLQSGNSLLDVIKLMKPFSIIDNQIVFYGNINSINSQQGALIVIDGQKMGTSISELDNVNPYDVVSINISTDPVDIQQYTALNTIGIIEINSRVGQYVSPDADKEDYVTSFEKHKTNNDVWKYQTSIYWETDVVPGEDGLIRRKFKVSNIKTNFVLQIDAQTTDGITHRETITFSTDD